MTPRQRAGIRRAIAPRTVAVLVAASLVGLAGCGGDEPPPGPRPRAVCLSPALAQMAFELDLGDHVVGVSRFAELPEGTTRPVVGDADSISAESTAALAPDVLLTQSQSHEYAALKQLRPDLEIERFRIETLADIAQALERMGTVLGNAERGKQKRAEFEFILSDVQARSADRTPQRAMFLIGYRRPYAAAKGTFIADMLALANAVNAAGEYTGWASVDIEHVIKAKPEVIICQVAPGEEDAARRYWMGFAELPAAQRERVYIVSDPQWTVPSFQLAERTRQLSTMLDTESGEGSQP